MEELKNRLLHNVKDYKRLICIALCAVMALMLIGCSDTDKGKGNEPFEVVLHTEDYQIWKHKETGVCYMWYRNHNSYAGGLTVMLNADGTPYTGE